ncbi:hypothetical protein RFI_19117, partial [Reticulomyxa filosa]
VIVRGRGHEIPQQANGDVIVMIRCAKHETFTRVGADLAMNYTLSLKEALCGFDFRVRHLSGKILRIKSKQGEIIQHEETKVLYGQGEEKTKKVLIKKEKETRKKDTTTGEEEEEEDDEPVEVHVEAESVEGEPEVTPASSKSAYDEDEEEQQGVQCRHM